MSTWTVYKLQHFIFRSNPEEKEPVATFKTKDEAYVKIRRMLRKQFPDDHDLVVKSELNGVWNILFSHEISTIIFIPVKND